MARSSSLSVASTNAGKRAASSWVVGDGKKATSSTHNNNNNTMMTRYLSSSPSLMEDKVAMPPNLKIDPRAVSSPFFGLDILEEVNDDDDDEEEEEEDDDDGIVWYQRREDDEEDELEKVIPLPDRLKVPVHSFSEEDAGEEVGTFFLAESVFGMDPIRVDLLHRCVVYQRNKRRGRRNAGAITKTISEVSGSGKKVRQQKGSGSARAGHKRPAHWRGGAKAHGPKGKIQDYTTKLNKKVRKLALQHALSQKLLENNLIIVNDMSLPTHKTSVLAKTLSQIADIGSKHGSTAYLLDHAIDQPDDGDDITNIAGVNINVKVASGNLFKIKLENQQKINVYDILKHEKLVLSLSAIQALEQRLT
jgi:large subunit ribosomal protein L4